MRHKGPGAALSRLKHEFFHIDGHLSDVYNRLSVLSPRLIGVKHGYN